MFGRLKKIGTGIGWRRCLFAHCVVLASVWFAAALDFAEVRELVRHRVPEETVRSIVQQGVSFELSPQQEGELRSLGASTELISALTSARVTLVPGPVAEEEAKKPLEFDDVKKLLRDRMPEQGILNAIGRGIAFELSPRQEGELRSLGAGNRLIAALETVNAGDEPAKEEAKAEEEASRKAPQETDSAKGNDRGRSEPPEAWRPSPTIIYDDWNYLPYQPPEGQWHEWGGLQFYVPKKRRRRRPPPPPFFLPPSESHLEGGPPPQPPPRAHPAPRPPSLPEDPTPSIIWPGVNFPVAGE